MLNEVEQAKEVFWRLKFGKLTLTEKNNLIDSLRDEVARKVLKLYAFRRKQ